MRPHLADALYERDYRVLFEQNAEYSRFLRHFYRRAQVRPVRVRPAPDATTATATLVIRLRDGAASPVTLDLARDPAGVWKITRISE